MEINFRNVNLNTGNINKVANKPDARLEDSNAKGSQSAQQSSVQTFHNTVNNVQFNFLSRAEQAILIRELLNLPKEIKELLSLLALNSDSKSVTAELLNSMDQKLLLTDIQKMLNTNSKDLLNKLLKLIQPTPGNIQNLDQLKEIITTIQSMIPSTNITNNETLKNLILLYLPWLPLVQPQDITVNYEQKSSPGEEDNESTLTIYFTTENMGRLKGIISTDISNSVNILIQSMSSEDNTNNFLEIINKRIIEEMKANNISGKAEINKLITSELNKPERREVSIQPGSNITPKALMAAYITTRVIFDLDEKITLNKKREKLVQEIE